jgi:hypothetical protein
MQTKEAKMKRLEGKAAVVTGGNSGIGLASYIVHKCRYISIGWGWRTPFRCAFWPVVRNRRPKGLRQPDSGILMNSTTSAKRLQEEGARAAIAGRNA